MAEILTNEDREQEEGCLHGFRIKKILWRVLFPQSKVLFKSSLYLY